MENFIMLVGIPGCGKSTHAKKIAQYHSQSGEVVTLSSDELRAEINGSEEDQSNTNLIFSEMFKRTAAALEAGKTVIYDATNISRKKRKDILVALEEVVSIPFIKKCIYFDCTVEIARERQTHRERQVPLKVLNRMFDNLEVPTRNEGWDSIIKIECQ